MKSLLFVLFLSMIAMSMAIQTSQTVQFLRKDTLNLLQNRAKYTVDQVLKLLEDLRAVEAGDLAKLRSDWETEKSQRQTAIDEAKKTFDAKVEECKDIGDEVATLKKLIDETEDDIQDSKKKIEENNQILVKRGDIRCANNLIFSEKIGKNLSLLDFLKYLKNAISKPSFKNYMNNFPETFAELKEHTEDNVIELITKFHLMHKMSDEPAPPKSEADLNKEFDVKERTKKEIGEGHVDNKKGAIEGAEYDYSEEDAGYFIVRLIKTLNVLIKKVEDENASLLESEIKQAEAYLKFKEQIEKDNHVLEGFIKESEDRLKQLAAALDDAENAFDVCKKHEGELEDALEDLKKEYDEAEKRFEESQTKMVDTVAALDQAIKIYKEKVVGAKGKYKERVKDYSPDETFDKTDFEKRKTDKHIDQFPGLLQTDMKKVPKNDDNASSGVTEPEDNNTLIQTGSKRVPKGDKTEMDQDAPVEPEDNNLIQTSSKKVPKHIGGLGLLQLRQKTNHDQSFQKTPIHNPDHANTMFAQLRKRKSQTQKQQ